jgi:1-acyl-sn-glycerol-3-phosphate acyltransferase
LLGLTEITSIFMLYSLKLVVIGMVTLPATIVIILVGLFDPYGKVVYEISRCWAWMILAISGVSLKVNGLSRIDSNRPYVFMVNHQSNIDIPVLVHSLPGFQLRWIAKKELLWVPLFGWAMWAAKHITVDRSDRFNALGSLKKAKQRMKAGVSIVVFPEGTRSTDSTLLPFKGGGFLLAVRAQTPIVPVTISGSGAILPKGDWRLRRGHVEVIVGEPVPVENYRPGTLRALSSQVEELIRKNLRPTSEVAEGTDRGDQSIGAPTSSLEEKGTGSA